MTAAIAPTRVQIPKLLPQQEPVARSPARFKLVRAGRRWGKDRLDLHAAIMGHGPKDKRGRWLCLGCVRAPHPADEPCFRGLSNEMDVVWLAPAYTQATLIWNEEIRPRFGHNPLVHLDDSEHTVSFGEKGGPTLHVRSAEAIETVRGIGKKLAGVIINEAARMDLEYAWRTVLRPALMDNLGWAMFTSTTNRGPDGAREMDGEGALKTPSFFNRLCAEVEAGTRGPDWAHFYGTALDNPKIDPKEFHALVAEYAPESIALQEEVYAQLLEAATGLVFAEWRDDLHVVETFTVPKGWRYGGGCDWGYRAPGWFGLFACGPDGDVVCVKELSFREQTDYQVGYAVGLICRGVGNVENVAGDEQMWYKTGVGAPTIAEGFQEGLNQAFGRHIEYAPKLVPATHGRGSRLAKLITTHQYLGWKAGPDGTVPPWGRPRLRFVRSACPVAIRTLPALPYDATKREDVDTHADDHAYDGLGAFLMSRPPLAEEPVRSEEPEKHPGFGGRKRRKKWEQQIREARGDEEPDHFRMPRQFVPVEEV